ncbi:uncharacterized protein EI90DRAFT_3042941 [Cantharellus anzutake]|uniref:uncharacterized protein n=1 Tax=Cantharellus anzutake TaxID=1750568 RepID=UPI0019037E3B|nr:uncharacterized protein EI90DRAFT_3042941 [Cantharellus anzutake]KAF8337427.1 hypothetical protein EI90DRAFT_3042941 [Cantharellus anzutake]
MEAPHEVSWESPLAVPDMTVPRQGSPKPGATGGKDDSFAKTTNGHNQTKERVPVFGGSHIAAPDPGVLVAATPMITTSSKTNCVEHVSSSLLVHKEPSINNGRDGFTGIAQDAPTGSSKLKRKGRSRGETHTENWAVTPRVLVVEDDLVARRLSSKFLQVSGCAIDVAEDGLKAVDKMNSKKYDLVLMDIMMPRLDGISATTLIRKFDQMTPIISMTTNSKPAEVETYYSNGMNDILPKPFTLDAMIDILDKHLNHLKRLKDLGECHNSLFKDDEAIVQEGIPTALGSIPSILLTPSFSDSYPTAEGPVSLSTFTDSTSHGPSSSASSAGYRIKDPSKIKLLKELEPESQRYPRIPLKSLRTSSKTIPKPPDIASPGLFSEGPDAEVTGTTVGGTTLPIFSSSKKREREEERGKGVKRIRFKIVDEETGAPPDQLVILELPDLGH